MGCGVRPPQGLGIKAVVYEFLVLKIGESLFLQGDDNTYSTILPIFLSDTDQHAIALEEGYFNSHIFFLIQYIDISTR